MDLMVARLKSIPNIILYLLFVLLLFSFFFLAFFYSFLKQNFASIPYSTQYGPIG